MQFFHSFWFSPHPAGSAQIQHPGHGGDWMKVFSCSIALALFLCLPCQALAANLDMLERELSQGTIRGRVWDSNTLAWLGIPYGEPPVGERRWKAPQDPAPWSHVLEATHFGSECIQISGLLLNLEKETFGTITGSEDCLFLNVWRPQTDEEKLPVFLWVHGGMNVVGEGATSLYHGAQMAHRSNMVVVTINFRLGMLGWFAHEALKTGDPLDDSGNYGLLDIIHALRWVQTNIEAFGGDPNNVTLAGESGGGANVISLLASPLAEGLFHRAISMSPASSLSSSSMAEAYDRAETGLVKLLQNSGDAKSPFEARKLIRQWDSSDIERFLRERTPGEIANISTKMSDWGLNEIGLTTDALGGSRYEDGAVVPHDFKGVFQRGEHNRVPLVIGSNTEEAKILEAAFGLLSKMDEQQLCDTIIEYDPDTSNLPLSDLVSWYNRPAFHLIGTQGGDLMFQTNGVDPVARNVSEYQSDVFAYRFTWNHQPAPFDFFIGASHMMELPFLFGNFKRDAQSLFRFSWSRENSAERAALSDDIMCYFASFSRTGNPNGEECGLPVWESWSNDNHAKKRMILDVEMKMTE